MACCGRQRRKFLNNVEAAKTKDNKIKLLVDIPDEELTEGQIKAKKMIIRIDARNKRIARRNEKAARINARQEKKH